MTGLLRYIVQRLYRPGSLKARADLMKALPLVVMVVALVVTPLSLRAFNSWVSASGTNVSYLPSFETRRTRRGFRPGEIEHLRAVAPTWVFIGDSMLGTRIDSQLLEETAGNGEYKVAVLMHAASGPAYWYLVFKNILLPSGVKPRMTFFFFRDTNLTDTMFRLQNNLGDVLDEVARDEEPALDAVVAAHQRGAWSRIDAALDRWYEVNTAVAWMQPSVRRWYAFWKYPDPAARLSFENAIEKEFNENFRRDLGADIGATDAVPRIAHALPASVLPLIVTLSKQHQVPVCFVRVQRRPVNNHPPPDSPALATYIGELRAYLQSQGQCFYDETGDPELTLDLYEDGDHVRDRIAYTKIFRRRLDPLFR